MVDRSLFKIKDQMMKIEDNSNKEITTIDEHLEDRYGAVGTRKRTEFEIKAKAFAIAEIIRDERKQNNLRGIS